MLKILIIWLNTILLLAALSSPASAPLANTEQNSEQAQIINDVIKDFNILATWLNDVYIYDGLLISRNCHDYETATQVLETGFDTDLAQKLVADWSQYVPDQDSLAIIPTDSIPLITAADRSHLLVRKTRPDQAVVQRVYQDVYLPGDAYLYQVISRFEDNHWLIVEIKLLPLDYRL